MSTISRIVSFLLVLLSLPALAVPNKFSYEVSGITSVTNAMVTVVVKDSSEATIVTLNDVKTNGDGAFSAEFAVTGVFTMGMYSSVVIDASSNSYEGYVDLAPVDSQPANVLYTSCVADDPRARLDRRALTTCLAVCLVAQVGGSLAANNIIQAVNSDSVIACIDQCQGTSVAPPNANP